MSNEPTPPPAKNPAYEAFKRHIAAPAVNGIPGHARPGSQTIPPSGATGDGYAAGNAPSQQAARQPTPEQGGDNE